LKAILIILLVVCVLVGGLLTLRSTRNTAMPGKDVLDRAKERARAQGAKDDKES
jgi:Protein of unknown function (DUF2897)